tara:strand:- start:3554 stop:5290 length:1737 start_codon:yes stop_codon:yes gene_type:complete
MVVSNPREPLIWTPRTQEMMGGFNPREVLDHDINPNEDSDGLSHHGRETPEDGRSRDQADPKKRRERALSELAAKIPHVSIKPQKIDDVLGRSPQFEQEQTMLEAGIGLDLNRNGIGLSNGMNAGSVRTEGPNVRYGMSNTLVPAMLGKAEEGGSPELPTCKNCGYKMGIARYARGKELCVVCDPEIQDKVEAKVRRNLVPKPVREIDFNPDPNEQYDPRFGDTSKYPEFTASEDSFTYAWDSVLKAKRRYKGRRMYDEEESDEDERKSKAKRKRSKRRKGKTQKKGARGGRQIKSASKRRASSVALDVDRGSKKQAFHPNIHSEAVKRIGSGRNEAIPLRLRDPVAWERKKANERMRRQVGSVPRALRLSHHADTRGMGTKGRSILGGTIGTGTRMPSVSRMGTSTSKFSRGAVGDPLGINDPLVAKMNPRLPKEGSLDGVLSVTPNPPTMNAGMPRDPKLLERLKRMQAAKLMAQAAEEDFDPKNSEYGINVSKSKPNISRSEFMAMKRKIEKLLQRLNKLTKATPELDNAGKVGAVVSGHESSAPTGATKTNEEEKAFRFVDMALAQEMGLIGKK